MNYFILPGLDIVSKEYRIDQLIKRVCKKFKIHPSELKERTRRHSVTEPKHIIYYIVRVEYGYTVEETSSLFNNDHSSVSYCVKKIKGFMSVDQSYKELVNGLIN
jgi:chromosomal replication initiation ATPase DnaA